MVLIPQSAVLLNSLYRLSRLRIRRLISWVIQGKDDLPHMSLVGIHSCDSLSKAFEKSIQSCSTVLVHDDLIKMTVGKVSFWL